MGKVPEYLGVFGHESTHDSLHCALLGVFKGTDLAARRFPPGNPRCLACSFGICLVPFSGPVRFYFFFPLFLSPFFSFVREKGSKAQCQKKTPTGQGLGGNPHMYNHG